MATREWQLGNGRCYRSVAAPLFTFYFLLFTATGGRV